MKKVLIASLGLLLLTTSAEAGRYGGGGRSYSRPTTIVHNNTTVIRSGGGGGSGVGAFALGAIVGSEMSRPQQVIVQPQQPVQMAPVVEVKKEVVVKEDDSMSLFQKFIMLCAGLSIIMFIVHLYKKPAA